MSYTPWTQHRIHFTLWVERGVFLVDFGVFLLQQGQCSVKVPLHCRVQLLGRRQIYKSVNKINKLLSCVLCRKRRRDVTTSLSSELDSDSESSAWSPYLSFTAQELLYSYYNMWGTWLCFSHDATLYFYPTTYPNFTTLEIKVINTTF